MPLSAITPAGTPSQASSAVNDAAFRDADFMKILMSEITHQDPFKPQDSQQIVESMQKLQQLANTRYEKTRDDQRWARDLVGDSVTVQQGQLSDIDVAALKEKGLNPDIGFQSQSGIVESFRVVGADVWLRVGGKDYQIDSVQQINPPKSDGADLAGMSGMLGRQVTWAAEGDSPSGSGQVTSLRLGEHGEVLLGTGNVNIPLSRVRGINIQ